MGKKIRFKYEREAALYADQMAVLKQRSAPKKQNKRAAPINLPAVCSTYPFQRPVASFKCSLCSSERRSAQLLKYLYCIYAVPAWLIDWLVRESPAELNSAAHERSVSLLMSIIYEMGGGRSPRNILKPYLSKSEMSLFFKIGLPANPRITVFGHFVYCKARAKGLAETVCLSLAKVADEQRLDKPDIFSFVQSFVEFCAAREVNQLSVQDIWDYLRSNRLIGAFSFKGRTLASMLNLVNSWHEALNREARILAPNRYTKDWNKMQAFIEDLKIEYKSASGIPRSWNIIDKNTSMPIEIRQLTKYTELINEGRAMHHCVATYHHACIQNSCYIFALRIAGERKATIEVRGNRVVQARGHCNGRVTGFPLQCLRKWMLKFKLYEEF